MHWLKKIVPQTMFGRLFGLVFLSVSISHLSFLALIIVDRPVMPPYYSGQPAPPKSGEIRPNNANFFQLPPPPNHPRNGNPARLFWLGLFFQFFVVILVARAGSRMMVKPIEELAQAATKLGNNLNSQPMVENGPIEAKIAMRVFNKMQQKIQEHIATRAQFLAAVSHDLRTPLTRIRLRIEQISNHPDIANKLQNDVDEMAALIDATLNFLRTNSEAGEWQLIDINALLQAMVDDAMEVGMPVILFGQAQPILGLSGWLRRAIQNLIENGVRYGERVEIYLIDTDTELQILISDFGTGIGNEDIPQVFEPFVRLERSRNKNTGGVGIGLSVAIEAIRRQGGDLTLNNKPDGGLCATILLKRKH